MALKECDTCGAILEVFSQFRSKGMHERRCVSSSDAERAYFKRTGHWPKKGYKLKQLPPEVPESPPVGGV